MSINQLMVGFLFLIMGHIHAAEAPQQARQAQKNAGEFEQLPLNVHEEIVKNLDNKDVANLIRSLVRTPVNQTIDYYQNELDDRGGGNLVKYWKNNPFISEVFKEYIGAARLVFSPDGKLLASADWHHGKDGGGQVRVFDMQTGRQVFYGRTKFAYPELSFSPDSELLIADSLIFSSNRGVQKGPKIKIRENVWIPERITVKLNNTELVVYSDRVIQLRDYEDKIIKKFEGHWDRVIRVAFSFDGKLLVSGDDNGLIRFWSVQTCRTIKILQTPTHTYARSFAFSPDGKQLAVSIFGTIKLLKVVNGPLYICRSGII